MKFYVLQLFLLGISYKMTLGAHEEDGLQVGADPAVIQREALALLLRTEHTQPGEERRVFPGLVNFSCSGSISSLVFIARNDTTPGTTPVITFSFWNSLMSMGKKYTAKLSDSHEVTWQDIELAVQPSQRDDIALYRAKFSPPLQFKGGDVLGIDQGSTAGGLAIQYVYDWGPENFVSNVTESIASSFVSPPVAVRDYPLLALEDYNCKPCSTRCVDGLLSTKNDLEQFLSMNFNPTVITPFLEDPNTSPLLRFTNDGSITRWSFTGSIHQLPLLQVWRANTSSGRVQYQRVTGSSTDGDVVNDNSDNATKYFVNQDISFREGDILAVSSYNSVRVVVGDIILSPDDYGTSGAEPDDMDTEFEPGVITISLVIDLDSSDDGSESSQLVAEHIIADPTYNTTDLNVQSDIHGAVPQFVVPYNGMLNRWMFAAKFSPTLASLQNPQLQVWRKEPNAFLDTFILVHSTNTSLEPTVGNHLGILEYVLEEPAPVKAGDILGFYQPRREESQLQLVFVDNRETAVYELSLIQSEPFILAENGSIPVNMSTPLISAEIIPDIDPTTSSSKTTATPTTSSEENKLILTRNEFIITAAAGAAVIAIGVVMICIILLCCCLKMTQEKKLRSRSSIYRTTQKAKSNSYTTGVYLKSHKSYNRSIKANQNVVQFDGRPLEPVKTSDNFAEMQFV